MEFDLDLTDYDNSVEMGITHITLKGGTAQFKLETEEFGSCPEETFYLGKVGELVSDDPDTWAIYAYDGYDFAYTDTVEPFTRTMISSGEYDFFAYVFSFDPCINKKAEIIPQMIGQTELDDPPIILITSANGSDTDTYFNLAGDFMYCIEQKYIMPELDAYGLGCDIRNKEEEAVVQTFEYTGDYYGQISGTIELRLIHEPEGDIYIASSSSNEPYPWER